MALRFAHGRGARSAIVRVETLPADELPAGVAAPVGASALPPIAPAKPRPRGKGRRFDATTARLAGDKGRAAQAAIRQAVALLAGLGLRDAQPAALAPFLSDARAFSEHERARLARVVGGGVCEGSAALLVDAAALATAASRAAYAAGDAALGARLSAEARSNLLGAHELCAREAKARPASRPAWMQGLVTDDAPARPPELPPTPPADTPSAPVRTAPDPEPEHVEPEPTPAREPEPTPRRSVAEVFASLRTPAPAEVTP
jgi:hypothetical protein